MFVIIQIGCLWFALQVLAEAEDAARGLWTDLWQVVDCRLREEAHFAFDYPKHGCNGGGSGGDHPYVHRIHCQIENLVIDGTAVHSAAKGGEPLDDSIMGQPEEAEFLKYDKGAFSTTAEKSSSFSKVLDSEEEDSSFYTKDIFQALEFNNRSSTTTTLCDETTTWKGTTLFMQRIEYANLYHTMMDWWNVVSSLPNNNNNNNTANNQQQRTVNDDPVNLIFLDAHPYTPLDDVWNDIIVHYNNKNKHRGGGGRMEYLQRLFEDDNNNDAETTTTACFERARMVPSGHTAPIEHLQSCTDPSRMEDFVNYFLEMYQLTHVRRIPGRIVVIDRVPYRAHPRVVVDSSVIDAAVRGSLRNLRKLALQLPDTLASSSYYYNNNHSIPNNVDVQVVTLVNQTMAEQIRTIRQASVLLATHGAGLSHSIFLESQAHVVEMNCYSYHFKVLAHWKPAIQYTCIKEKVSDTIDENMYWQPVVVSAIAKALEEQSTAATYMSTKG